jgi:hypothetical protein
MGLFAKIDSGEIFHVEGGKNSLTKDKTDLITDEEYTEDVGKFKHKLTSELEKSINTLKEVSFNV